MRFFNYSGLFKDRSRVAISSMSQPCQLALSYNLSPGGNYIDTARDLSRVNRKLYRQGRLYVIAGVTFQWKGVGENTNNLVLSAATAADQWVVRNAWTKGQALWKRMQKLVLDDSPSVAGKWHDFKVILDSGMITATTRDVQNWEGFGTVGSPVNAGEWNHSTYVMPQHEVDPATGLPLPADEFDVFLIGADTLTRRSLTNAYQMSRAQVQAEPALDPDLDTSFYTLLSDTGSQEPELAQVIEDENDFAPYDMNDYGQGAVNAVEPYCQGFETVSAFAPTGRLPGFTAPCGLIKLTTAGIDAAGDEIPAPDDVRCIVHMFPGAYSGVMAEAM